MTRSPQDIDREIVPRKGLDFHLREDDIPKYWFANDPFKTRFFDAMSLLFPEGEKFFIQCVRDYKDQVTDPKLLEEIRDFTFQEGQHSMVHIEFNNRVARQGVAVPEIMAYQKKFMAAIRRRLPRQYTLGMTAAAEHMTALMAHYFLAARKPSKTPTSASAPSISGTPSRKSSTRAWLSTCSRRWRRAAISCVRWPCCTSPSTSRSTPS